MTRSGLEKLESFWRNIYLSEKPMVELEKYDGPLPIGIDDAMGDDGTFYPEPFYGYFHEDMSKDVLLLLINPGSVKASEEKRQRWNSFIQERYTKWNAADYLEECARKEDVPKNNCNCRLNDLHDTGCRWRRRRWEQFENILGKKVNFMHTMEFFPYHSKELSDFSKHYEWIFSRETTRMSIEAIIDIATNKRIKHIVGIGKFWVEIFRRYGIEPNETEVIMGKSRPSFKFYKYKFTENSTPIVISLLGGGHISLPKDTAAVSTLRRLLEIGN